MGSKSTENNGQISVLIRQDHRKELQILWDFGSGIFKISSEYVRWSVCPLLVNK